MASGGSSRWTGALPARPEPYGRLGGLMPDKPLILFDHDGGVDDYLSIMLLMTYAHLEVLGIVVTPADCYIGGAVGATRKILDHMGRSDVPVAQSSVRGLYPFPRENRRDSI